MTTTREPGGERTIGQLVADATHDISSIVHNEIALAKTELKNDAKAAGKGAGMVGAACVASFVARSNQTPAARATSSPSPASATVCAMAGKPLRLPVAVILMPGERFLILS